MAGKSQEEIERYAELSDEEQDTHLLGVFVKDVMPNLPDKVVNGDPNVILFDGKEYKNKGLIGQGGNGTVHRYSTNRNSVAVKRDRGDPKKAFDELCNQYIGQGSTLTSTARGVAKLLGAIWSEGGMLVILEDLPDRLLGAGSENSSGRQQGAA